jgi:hypothetical protein
MLRHGPTPYGQSVLPSGRHEMPATIRGAPPLKQRSDPAFPELGRLSRQIGTERPANTSAANDRQEGFADRRMAVEATSAVWGTYQRLRLAERDDPALAHDLVRQHYVRATYATFRNRFDGLRP